MPALIPALTARLRIFVVYCLFVAAFTAGSFGIFHLAFSPAPGVDPKGITTMSLILGLFGGTVGWGIATAPKRLPELPKWLNPPRKPSYLLLSITIFFVLGLILQFKAPIVRSIMAIFATLVVSFMMDHRKSVLIMEEHRLRVLELAKRLIASMKDYTGRVQLSKTGMFMLVPYIDAITNYANWRASFPNPLFKVQLVNQLTHLKIMYDEAPEQYGLPSGEIIQNAVLRLLDVRRNTFERDEAMIESYIARIDAVRGIPYPDGNGGIARSNPA